MTRHPRPKRSTCPRCGGPLSHPHDCRPRPAPDVPGRRQCPHCRGYYSGEACVCRQAAARCFVCGRAGDVADLAVADAPGDLVPVADLPDALREHFALMPKGSDPGALVCGACRDRCAPRPRRRKGVTR